MKKFLFALVLVSGLANAQATKAILNFLPEGEFAGVGVIIAGERDACWVGVEKFSKDSVGLYISADGTSTGERSGLELDFNFNGSKVTSAKAIQDGVTMTAEWLDVRGNKIKDTLTLKRGKDGSVTAQIVSVSPGFFYGTNTDKAVCKIKASDIRE